MPGLLFILQWTRQEARPAQDEGHLATITWLHCTKSICCVGAEHLLLQDVFSVAFRRCEIIAQLGKPAGYWRLAPRERCWTTLQEYADLDKGRAKIYSPVLFSPTFKIRDTYQTMPLYFPYSSFTHNTFRKTTVQDGNSRYGMWLATLFSTYTMQLTIWCGFPLPFILAFKMAFSFSTGCLDIIAAMKFNEPDGH